MAPVTRWILGFLLLNLYVNLIPKFLAPDQIGQWLVYWTGFFGLAFIIARYLLLLKGISRFGLMLQHRWVLKLAVGFLIGFFIYALKYGIFYSFDKFQVSGFMSAAYISQLLLLSFLAMFFSSMLNDVMIRGYLYSGLQKAKQLRWYLFLATLLYTLDDIWNQGFEWTNLLFSLILGFAFAYTVLKTGAIWMSLGMHWGGNIMFRIMYGFDGQGVLRVEHLADGPLFESIGLANTALLIPIVFIVLKNSQPEPEVRNTAY
jgi:uncharacterized protein